MDTPHVFIRDVLPAPERPQAVPTPHRRSLSATILVVSLAAIHPIATALRAQVAELGSAPLMGPDAVVATGVLAMGLLAALWYALTGLVLLLSHLVRRDLGVSRWGAPFARRLALGAGLGLLAFTPAQADTPDDVSWGAVAVLHEARVAPPLLTAPAGSASPLMTASPPTAAITAGASPSSAAAAGEPGPSTHVVAAGECLWTIAAREFDSPTLADVALRVADWVEANPHLVANPDLIHPGELLVVPTGAGR